MPRYRTFRPNHSVARPTQLIVVSTDTVPVKHPLTGRRTGDRLSRAFATFCRLDKGQPTRECGTTVTDPALFWRWACQRLDPRRTTWILSHNAGTTMQALGLFPALDSGLIELDYPRASVDAEPDKTSRDSAVGGLFVVQDPPVIIGIRSAAGHRATIVDARNYVDCTMDELSRFIDRKRLESSAWPDKPPSPIERLARDCQIVRDYLLALIDIWHRHDLGMWRWTTGGLALGAFRHRLMPHPPQVHDDIEVRAMEREGYRGGEVLVPYVGDVPGTSYAVDVTSLYPHVMRTNMYPVKLIDYVCLKDWHPGVPPGEPIAQLAEVAIDTGDEPVTIKTATGSLRVQGRCTMVLCGPELERACLDGWVRGWRRLANYAMAPIFRDYVDTLWPLRQKYLDEGDVLGAKFIKLLLVSLYGKFGQYGYKLTPRPNVIAPRKWQQWKVVDATTRVAKSYISIGERVYEESRGDDHPMAAVAVAAWVTSYGREYMRCLREHAGVHHWYYQSTDSLILDQTGLDNLYSLGWVGANTLGRLRVEHQGEDTHIDGAHDYYVGGHRVVGWRSAQAIETEPGIWTQSETESLRLAYRHAPEEGCIVNEQRKQRQDSGVVGRVGPDGWTIPVTLDCLPPSLR